MPLSDSETLRSRIESGPVRPTLATPMIYTHVLTEAGWEFAALWMRNIDRARVRLAEVRGAPRVGRCRRSREAPCGFVRISKRLAA